MQLQETDATLFKRTRPLPLWQPTLAALCCLTALGCDDTPAPPVAPALPDITLISLDTVRQDRGPGPWGQGVMPNYSRFAAGATRFSQAWAPSSNTLVTHGSLFTGRFPWAHGYHPTQPAPTAPLPLLERLADAGYEIAVFTTHPTWLGVGHGFNHRAAQFRSEAVPGEQVLPWVQAFVDSPRRGPRFLFVHLYDAHSDTHRHPYEAPDLPEAALAFEGCLGTVCASKMLKAVDAGTAQLPEGAAEAIRAGYDAGVAHADALLGELLRITTPQLGAGLVAVFSDHGELLGEEGAWLHHGGAPWVLDIPLAVRAPGQEQGAVEARPVSLVHLFDTVLEAAEVPMAHHSTLAQHAAAEEPVVAMGAARKGDQMTVERPGGAMSAFKRGQDGRWTATEPAPALEPLATNPVEALNAAATEALMGRPYQEPLGP